MVTTGIAMVFIRKGKVHQHRQWMTRSFAVALVFLEGRVIGGVTGWENLGDHANETIVWPVLRSRSSRQILCFSGRNWRAHARCCTGAEQFLSNPPGGAVAGLSHTSHLLATGYGFLPEGTAIAANQGNWDISQ